MVGSSRGRLTELDALRGIGALCVLIFHYSTRFHELFPQASHVPFSFPGGNYRVLLFFTISGFAIFFTLDRIRTVADFVVNRFARLYPAYLVAMLLTLSIEYLAHATQLLIGPVAIFANFTKVASAEQLAPMLRSHTHHHHPLGPDLKREVALYAQDLKLASVFKPSTDPAQFADRVCAHVLAT